MIGVVYKTFKEFGLDTFCVGDYMGYIRDNDDECEINYERVAGVSVGDDDSISDVESFIKMAIEIEAVSIIVIDFSRVSDSNVQFVESIKDSLNRLTSGRYFDLNSYEFRFAYGLLYDNATKISLNP